MADEVVGKVTVDVHGNTDPLKRDIRQAATEAGKTIDDSIGKGAAGSAITDNIVEQVADAEAPSEREGQKVGRAIVRGVEGGTSRLDLRSRISAQLRDIEAPLRTTGERIKQSLSDSIGVNEAPLRAVGVRLNKALTDAMGGLSDTGSAIGREWDKRLDNIDARIAQAIAEGPRKAAVTAARDMGAAWDRALTRVDDRIGRMSFAPFREKIAAFGQMWDQTLTRMDDRVGAMSFTPLVDRIHGLGDAWDATLTRMDNRVGQFDPLATLRGLPGRWDEMLTRMDDRVGRFDPAVTFRAAMAKISDAAQKFNPSLAGVKAWQAKFRDTLRDDRGMLAIGGFAGSRVGDGMFAGIANRLRALRPSFGRAGEQAGGATAAGMKKSMLQAGIESAFMAIAGKAALMGPAIAFGIRAAAPVITGLISQISVLGTALGGLGAVGAASMATLIPGIGALKIAFAGLDAEAKKALTAKFTAAMGDLAGFKERVRNEIIPSLVEALKTVSQLAPEINALGTSAAQAGGKIAKSFAEMLVGRKEEIGNIFGNSSKVMESFGNIGTKAVDVIINALDALQPLVIQMVGSVEKVLSKFADTLNRGIDNGSFLRTMTLWYERGKTLMSIFGNLGRVVGNFFKAAAGASDGFLDSFDRVTQEWADWTASLEGQNTLKEMFDDAVPVVEEVWGLLGDIAGLFTESFTGDTGGLVEFIQDIRENVIPGLKDFQEVVRDSGMQDALYDLAEAFLELFKAGGGTTMTVFVETLAEVVEIVADLLDVLGPVLVPLGTFLGMFRALQVTKTAFSGLFALPQGIKNLISPAKGAAGALGSVSDSVGDTTAQLEANEDAASTAKDELGKLGAGVEIALSAWAVFSAAVSASTPKFDDSAEHIEALVKAVEDGSASLKETGEGIGDNFWEKWVFGGVLSGDSVRNFGEEMGADLGDSFMASLKQTMASIPFLPADWGGIEGTIEGVNARLAAIAGVAKTDWQAAEEAYNQLVADAEKRHVDVTPFVDGMKAAQKAIREGRLEAEQGITLTGNFDTIKTGMESFAISFDANITRRLNDLAKNPLYIDAKGGLTNAGKAERKKILLEADMDTVNGLDNAIDQATEDKIRQIHVDPTLKDKNGKPFLDKYGNLTTEGIKAVVELTVGNLNSKENQERLVQQAKDLQAVVAASTKFSAFGELSQKEFEKVGRQSIRLYAPDIDLKDLSAQAEGIFGRKVIDMRARLTAQGFEPGEIEKLMASYADELVAEVRLEAKTAKLTAQMDTYMTSLGGKDWGIELDAIVPEGDLVKIDGQLMRMTAPGKWEAIVGAEAEAAALAETEGKFRTLVAGPDGTWDAVIHVSEVGVDSTLEEIYAAAKDQWTVIHVSTKWLNPRTGEYTTTPPDAQLGGPRPAYDVIIPGGEEGVPPTISPGGPSTMGFGSNLGPVAFGIATRAGIPLGGDQVIGRPNYKGDKDKDPRNVTINNYYPEPERVSDTIAMQMRIARFA